MIEKKIKRIAVAAAAGISVQSFTNWTSRGSIPAADVLYRIAKYLGVSVPYLLTGKEENGELTTEERDLVDKFRVLDARDRAAVVTLTETLGERYTSASPAAEQSPAG